MKTMPRSLFRVLWVAFASGIFLASCASVPDPVLTRERDEARESLRTAELTIAGLRDSLATAERSLAELGDEIAKLQAGKGQLGAENQEQLLKINEKLSMVARLEAEQDRLSRELDAARAVIVGLRESESATDREFRATIERLEGENRDKSERNTRLGADLDEARRELAGKELELRGLQATHDATLGRVNAGKSDLENMVRHQSEEIAALKGEINRVLGDKKVLEEELARDRQRLTAATDLLRKSLATEIAAGDIELRQVDNVLIINMRDSIIFAPDRADLNPRYGAVLMKMAEVFRQLPEKNIRIEGHTAVGVSSPETLRRYPTSWDLAAARAISVLRFFRERAGIDGSRLVASSFGEYRPVAPNDSEESKQANRRVRIVLVNRPVYETP